MFNIKKYTVLHFILSGLEKKLCLMCITRVYNKYINNIYRGKNIVGTGHPPKNTSRVLDTLLIYYCSIQRYEVLIIIVYTLYYSDFV